MLRKICWSTAILLAGLAIGAPQAARRNGRTPARKLIPEAFARLWTVPSPLRFLASDVGRRYLAATGHPLAHAAILAFGEPAQGTTAPRSWTAAAAVNEAKAVSDTVSCTGNSGARFNLEPRPNAVPQNEASADFLLNRLGPNLDLVVQTANDWRGNLAPPEAWDQSVSGYYVHRALTADCSVQFEGGLPSFTAQGNTEMGIGNVVVVADPLRDTFYAADARFGSASLGGVGLFKATASTLLNSTLCPSGTHLLAQATSCWAATPPVLLFPESVAFSVGAPPRLAVDARQSGTGAGNVYVVNQFTNSQLGGEIVIAACTSALKCSAPTPVNGSFLHGGFPYVQVRSDGLIMVSMVNTNADSTLSILFTTCTPAGAPNAPVCGQPVVVQTLPQPIQPNEDLVDLANINLLAWTFPKHATRAEPGGGFTTFMVYDDCKNQLGSAPSAVCLDAQALLTWSTNNGETWSTPVSIDTSTGHHFYSAIALDSSTGVLNLAYYTTAGDTFNHEVHVVRNQIAPGGTALGTGQLVTSVLDPFDGDPFDLGVLQSDFFLGIVSRGTGAAGGSRVYTSFDSTVVAGTYSGLPDPEQNNSISQATY